MVIAMGATRKLQGEIDRCLKKVSEGVETFEDIWQKVHNSTNTNQKEKYETDLNKEIKKLQRLREQIKSWIVCGEIKDKSTLVDTRKLIEIHMDRYKVLKRETKTKAYSKEGLDAAQKLDPTTREREDLNMWLMNSIDQLQLQLDQFENEIELIMAAKKKKQDKDKQDRLDKLKIFMDRHKFHISKLETLVRMLDNLSTDVNVVQLRQFLNQVKKIKDDIEYYLESSQEPEFEENEFLYDDIEGLEEQQALGNLALTADPDLETPTSITSGNNSPSPIHSSGSGSDPEKRRKSSDDSSTKVVRPVAVKANQSPSVESKGINSVIGSTPPINADTPNNSSPSSGLSNHTASSVTNPSLTETTNSLSSNLNNIETVNSGEVDNTISSGLGLSSSTPLLPNTSNHKSNNSTGNSSSVVSSNLDLNSTSVADPTNTLPNNMNKIGNIESGESNSNGLGLSTTTPLLHGVNYSMNHQNINSSSSTNTSSVVSGSLITSSETSNYLPNNNMNNVGKVESGNPDGSSGLGSISSSLHGINNSLNHKNSYNSSVVSSTTTGTATINSLISSCSHENEECSNNQSNDLTSSHHHQHLSSPPQTQQLFRYHSQQQQQQQHQLSSFPHSSQFISNNHLLHHDSNSPRKNHLQYSHPSLLKEQHSTTSTIENIKSSEAGGFEKGLISSSSPETFSQSSTVCATDGLLELINNSSIPSSRIGANMLSNISSGNTEGLSSSNMLSSLASMAQDVVDREGLLLSDSSKTSVAEKPTTEAHIPPFLCVAPLGPFPLQREHQYQLQMLETAQFHMPVSADSERVRQLLPRNPILTPSYYPQHPLTNSDSLEFFQRLSIETLFFIFYHLEGSKAQYLAAKVLKKQSWRFHTKYMMWFHRYEEPKVINEEYEQGTYIYFDIEKWGQRKKNGFVFEYRYLEDSDL